jgi:glycosyltransferase involved in cell wall biosynthesis
VHIVGDGPERPHLEQLANELQISDRVHFDNTISSSAMPAYLQQLDVLVLSSRTKPNWKEQFGRALVEAMACEVPVIGSDSGEIPHVIGSAGLLFPEDDVGALRSHLLKLMQSVDLRRELGQCGRQRVLSLYTQSQIAAQTVAVYRDMLN